MPALLTSTSMRSARDSAVATDRLDRLRIGDVDGEADRSTAEGARRGLGRFGVDVGDDDTRTLGGERLRGGAADAARAAGNQAPPYR